MNNLRYRWRSEHVFFLIAFAALLLVFRERGLNDPGTLWHTRVGGLILDRGFMATDPFTFTFEGKTWIPQQWGGEVLMALLYRVNGFDSILVAYLALFAAAFAAVFHRLLAGGMGWPLAAGVAGFAMVAAGFHLYARPHVFTIALMVLVTLFLIDFNNKRCTWKHLLWLIPIHIVWTNLHGGILGGVATIVNVIWLWLMALPANRIVRGLTKRPDIILFPTPITTLREALILIGIAVACGLTMFVNPIGWELQETWFRLIGSKTLSKYVPEHSPLNINRGGDLAIVAFAAFYCILLITAYRQKMIWWMPGFWLIGTTENIRNGPLFVAVAAVMIADMWPHTLWYRKLRASGDGTLATEPTAPTPFPWLAVLAISAVSIFIIRGWAHFDPRYVPVDIIDAVRNIPPGERIYNDPNFGGFLIWHAPTCKIFMDDRFELCGDAWLHDYVENPQFDAWQRQYGFRWALVRHDEPLDNGWEPVARGTNATLYYKR